MLFWGRHNPNQHLFPRYVQSACGFDLVQPEDDVESLRICPLPSIRQVGVPA